MPTDVNNIWKLILKTEEFVWLTVNWMSVNSSNSTLVYFKAACHANPGTEINFEGSSS